MVHLSAMWIWKKGGGLFRLWQIYERVGCKYRRISRIEGKPRREKRTFKTTNDNKRIKAKKKKWVGDKRAGKIITNTQFKNIYLSDSVAQ